MRAANTRRTIFLLEQIAPNKWCTWKNMKISSCHVFCHPPRSHTGVVTSSSDCRTASNFMFFFHLSTRFLCSNIEIEFGIHCNKMKLHAGNASTLISVHTFLANIDFHNYFFYLFVLCNKLAVDRHRCKSISLWYNQVIFSPLHTFGIQALP